MPSNPVPKKIAERIWDVLVKHAGANSNPHSIQREDFIQTAMSGTWTEFRFQGLLGFGGKVWNANNNFYVTCYKEDEDAKRKIILRVTNDALRVIHKDFAG